MKRKILICIVLLCSIMVVNAQWTTTHPIYNMSNVGINTDNPQSKLHILDGNNNIRIGDFNASTAGIELSDGQINSSSSVYLFGWGNSFRIGIGSPNETNHLFTLLNTGRVGIGTMTPEANLHIKYTNITPNAILRLESSAIEQNASMQYVTGGVWRWELGTGISSQTNFELYDRVNNKSCFVVKSDGTIGIGTITPKYKLDVIGTIRASEIIVDLNGADFVFEENYKLMPLNELEKFVKEQKHLPEIAPAKEMEKNGTDLGNLNSKLLQKIEELTLYTIQQNKKIEHLLQQNNELQLLKEKITIIEAAINKEK